MTKRAYVRPCSRCGETPNLVVLYFKDGFSQLYCPFCDNGPIIVSDFEMNGANPYTGESVRKEWNAYHKKVRALA
jgi:hypothetical protein